jgi:hypothetical protein
LREIQQKTHIKRAKNEEKLTQNQPPKKQKEQK